MCNRIETHTNMATTKVAGLASHVANENESTDAVSSVQSAAPRSRERHSFQGRDIDAVRCPCCHGTVTGPEKTANKQVRSAVTGPEKTANKLVRLAVTGPEENANKHVRKPIKVLRIDTGRKSRFYQCLATDWRVKQISYFIVNSSETSFTFLLQTL